MTPIPTPIGTDAVETGDCEAFVETHADRGGAYSQDPEAVTWGVDATVEECYGNLFDVVEPTEG